MTAIDLDSVCPGRTGGLEKARVAIALGLLGVNADDALETFLGAPGAPTG